MAENKSDHLKLKKVMDVITAKPKRNKMRNINVTATETNLPT